MTRQRVPPVEHAEGLPEPQPLHVYRELLSILPEIQPGQGRAIEIVNATVDRLTEQLVASRNGLSFDFVESPRRGGRGSFSLDDDVDEEEEAKPVVIPGDIDTLLTTPDLLRRLRTLRRKDREWEEEQGLTFSSSRRAS